MLNAHEVTFDNSSDISMVIFEAQLTVACIKPKKFRKKVPMYLVANQKELQCQTGLPISGGMTYSARNYGLTLAKLHTVS